MKSNKKLSIKFFSLFITGGNFRCECQEPGRSLLMIKLEVQNPVTLSLPRTEPMENHQALHLKIVKKSLALIYILNSHYRSLFYNLFSHK
jgi:hypothetical protein